MADEDAARPFAVGGAVRGVPAVPILGLVSVALMMTQLDSLAIIAGSAACAVGLAAGWLGRSRQ